MSKVKLVGCKIYYTDATEQVPVSPCVPAPLAACDAVALPPLADAEFAPTMDPGVAETLNLATRVEVQFDLLAPADVTLHIHREGETHDFSQPDGHIREVTLGSLGAGTHAVRWDGCDENGEVGPEDVFEYMLNATSGTSEFVYDPFTALPGEPQNNAWPYFTTTYNAFENRWFTGSVDFQTYNGRVKVRVSNSAEFQETDFVLVSQGVPVAVGPAQPFYYNGRMHDETGALQTGIFTGPFSIDISADSGFQDNAGIVRRLRPTVTGEQPLELELGSPPTIEVRSNPFLVYHTYDQISTITYCLDQTAIVTIKILHPDEINPSAPGIATLVDSVQEPAGCRSVEWRDLDKPDEGAYTFAIEARSVAPFQAGKEAAFTSLTLGTIQVLR